jgi:transposase
MESTAIYWVPIWNILEEMGFDLLLVNPYQIKQMPGKKSDVKDAQWIAQLLHKGLLRSSFVPDKTIRELRTYSRMYVQLQRQKTGVLIKMEHTLEKCNIRITNFVSNISSKSIYRVIKALIARETDPVELEKCIHGRIKNKHKEMIREALTGYMPEHHRFALELLMEDYDHLLMQEEKILHQMQRLCEEHYAKEIALLSTIPGINHLAAMLLIAECGADMKAFENSSKFAGWTGLRPRNDESNGKYKSTATTKGNQYFRSTLVNVTWGAVRMKDNMYLNEKYNRLVIRKSRKKALIAMARKMTVIIWNVLTYKQPFNPDLLPVIQDPQKIANKIKYHEKELERIKKLVIQ